jgi:cytochrome b561
MHHPDHYSRLQVTLHWTIAVLIVVQLLVNADMQQAFAQRLATGVLPPDTGAVFHAVIGLSVLVLAALRLAIRLWRGTPEAPPDNSALVNLLSHATHLLLYGFLFLMPITGALAWFFGIELAATLHELGRLVLIPAILLHIAGVLVEELLLDNRIFRRMVRPGRS